jgi:hypothetical protein
MDLLTTLDSGDTSIPAPDLQSRHPNKTQKAGDSRVTNSTQPIEIRQTLESFIHGNGYFAGCPVPRNVAKEEAILIDQKACIVLLAAIGTDRFGEFMMTDNQAVVHPCPSALSELQDWRCENSNNLGGPFSCPFPEVGLFFHTGEAGELAGKLRQAIFEYVPQNADGARHVPEPLLPESMRAPNKSILYEKPYVLCVLDLERHLWERCASGCLSRAPTNGGMPFAGKRLDRYDAGQRGLICQALGEELDRRISELHATSLLDLCLEASGRDFSVEQVIDYFRESPVLFGKAKGSGLIQGKLQNRGFPGSGGTTAEHDDGRETCLDQLINRLVLRYDYSVDLGSSAVECDERAWRRIFDFRDKYRDVKQKAIRLFDVRTQSKVILPCTSWTANGIGRAGTVCLPHPEGQTLYNLHLLAGESVRAIVLTDSIEIAHENQLACRDEGIVWTSFLPVEELDCVDWTPLTEAGPAVELFYLITNHSGRSMAQAYCDAHRITTHIPKTPDLGFNYIHVVAEPQDRVFAATGDSRREVYFSMEELTRGLREAPVCVSERQGSVQILDQAGFDQLFAFAKAELTVRQKPEFWQEGYGEENSEEGIAAASGTKASRSRKPAIDFLMRPAIYRGQRHSIFSYRGLGKTSFSLSLCACIVSGRRFLENRLWVPPARDKKDDGSRFQKVVYFLLETKDYAKKDELLREFVRPHLLTAPELARKCESNFTIIGKPDIPNCDLREPQNQSQVMELLEKAKLKGTKGRPVDLVVFDTYSEIVGGKPYGDNIGKLTPLFDRIQAAGTAILLIDHTDKPGPKQVPRGYKSREDGYASAYHLFRPLPKAAADADDDNGKTLATPFFVAETKNSSSVLDFDGATFSVRREGRSRKWEEPGKDETSAARNYMKAADDYGGLRYAAGAMAEMLGYSPKTHGKKMTEYRKQFGKAPKGK